MNGLTRGFRRLASGAVVVAGLVAATFSPAAAQTAEQNIERIPLPAGRSYPIQSQVPVTRVSVANPAVADVVVIGERDLVINARSAGETDVIIWTGETRRHFRIIVNPPVDRRQISLGIVFAEVRKDAAEDKRSAEYKVAKEKCDAMSGDAKDKCVSNAKLKYAQ